MHKRTKVLVLTLGLALSIQANFIMEDFPEEPSLQLDPPTEVDAPEGRIVIIEGISSSSPALINTFYEKTLPNLGWRKISLDTYLREKEKLEIKMDSKFGITHITFTFKPE